MTAANAFLLVAVLCALTLVVGFLTWKFKYVIWKGWFRAIIECEDEDILIKTFRLKSKKSPVEQDQTFYLTVKGIRDQYDIIPDRVRRMGRFRIPTSLYYAHRKEPLDFKTLKMESQVSATRSAELAKNTVTSQLLTAFTESNMREAMAVFLAVAIVLGGILILGYWMNTKLTQLEGLLT